MMKKMHHGILKKIKLDEEVHGQPQFHTLLGMAHLLSLVITMP